MKKEIQWLLEERYNGKLTPAAKKDIVRLNKGEHIDYVIGFVDFAGCTIDLSRKPLIPRPETEHWVLQVIEDVKQDRRKKLSCLDIFAGSGCIGIALQRHLPKAHMDYAEKEKRFVEQIRLNLKKNGITAKRAHVFQSNVFSNVEGEYDYILANPPYIAESRRKSVQASVLKQEPKGALFAGKDGLRYIRRFLKEAKNHLNSGGRIYLEFDSPQRNDIEALLKRFGYFHWQFSKDQYGKWRFAVITN